MKVRQAQAIPLPRRLPTPSRPEQDPAFAPSGVPGLVLPGGTVLTPAEVTARLDADAVSQLKAFTGRALAAAHPLAGEAWSAAWLVVGTRKLVDRWAAAEDLSDLQLWLDTASTALKAAGLAGKHIPAAQAYMPAITTMGMVATTASGAYKAVVELDRTNAARLRAVVGQVRPTPQKA
ncbi:MAG: hypothetical protein U1E14_15785 [Geminicoccaceae bacterium]